MGGFNETVRTVNSALRTLLVAVLTLVAAVAGWKGYSLYNEPQKKLAEKQREVDALKEDLQARNEELSDLSVELEAKSRELERLQTSMRLLRLSHRIARIDVVDQREDPETGREITSLEFYEVNSEGAPVDERRQRIELEGKRVYVECLVAKFEDKYVEQADLERATAICLFQRIFGEYQQPQEGVELDKIGSSPTAYSRGGQTSEFEQRIWDDFWNIAHDPSKAAELGIRAAHSDAPSTEVRKGFSYELELRSTGEFTLRTLQLARRSTPEPSA